MTCPTPVSKLQRDGDARVVSLARSFGDALRTGDGATAERIASDALAAGLAPEAVQSLVIAPAMVRIGELWEAQLIGVADEHLATSLSQRALIRLFEALSAKGARARSRERVLLAAVEGQHHVLGLRMVADVLEGAGFDVLYLGEDVPVSSLRAFVAEQQPAVAGLAFGIAADVSCLADSLWAIHETSPQTRILLGGRAVPPGLRDAGYAFAADTTEVVEVVEALLAAPLLPLPAVLEPLRSDGTRRAWARETAVETDPLAESLAKSAEQAVELARKHVRRAETYRELAFRDPLTDLANRRAFDDELSTLASSSTPSGALLMIDVDGFKSVNDTQGHQAGDQLLRAVGKAIADAVRPSDLAARFGGDEFAVLLPGAPPALACEIGERIRLAVAQSHETVTVSVGAATLSGDARGALLAADTALYRAKAAGRNRVVAADRVPGDDEG